MREGKDKKQIERFLEVIKRGRRTEDTIRRKGKKNGRRKLSKKERNVQRGEE